MQTQVSRSSASAGGVVRELESFIVKQDAGRERIANRLRQLWQGLERFEEALGESDLSDGQPEIDSILTELSPKRVQLIFELSQIETTIRTETSVGLPELWRELERAISLVNAYEAEVSDLFLRAFWLDLGVGD